MSAVTATSMFVWSSEAALTAAANKYRFVAPCDGVILNVEAACLVAPVGASIILDINKGGTTIFTTQSRRPTIAAAATTATVGDVEVTSFSAGDVFTVDCDQVGSSTAGTGFSIAVAYAGKTALPTGTREIDFRFGEVEA